MYPFASPMMIAAAGKIVVPATTTWNPADAGAGLTFTNGNRTVTHGAETGFQTVRTTTARTSGKLYAEVGFLYPARFTQDYAFGLYGGSEDLAQRIGITGVCVTDTGNVQAYGSNAGPNVGSFSTTDIAQIAVDFGARLVWFGRNGTWSGNPAAGTGGISISTGALFLAGTTWAPSEKVGLNCGQDPFAYALPSGFSQWG